MAIESKGLMTPYLTDADMIQRQLDEERALAIGKLSGSEARGFLAATAGREIGRGIAGLFGEDITDPKALLAAQLGKIRAGIDPSNEESVKEAARKLTSLGYGAAGQDLLKTFAEYHAKTAEKLPNEVKLARALADTQADPKTAEWAKIYNSELKRLTDKEEKISYGTEADRLAKAVYGKNFKDLSQDEAKLVDNELEKRGLSKARAGKPVTQLQMAPDVVGAVNAVDKATEKEVAMLESARLAKDLINQTASSNNSQTWEAARTTIAKAVGENKLSNEDIRRTGVDPRLVQGALDWVDKKITGVPSQDIQKQLYVLGSVLENNASKRYDDKVFRYRAAAQAASFPGQPSTYFPTAAERTQQSQPKVVDWSSLK